MNNIELATPEQDVFPRDQLAIRTGLGRVATLLAGSASLAAGVYMHVKYGHDLRTAHWVGAAFDGAGAFMVGIAANEQRVANHINQQAK